jgi:uncharacterized membrane protein
VPFEQPGLDGKPTSDDSRRHPARQLRNYLIAGLLIWIPVMVTVWVVTFLSGILDTSLLLLPPSWRPEALVGSYVPGVGIILSLALLVVTGVVVRNLFGGQIIAGIEGLIRRIPVIGAIYGGAKTFSETVLTDKGKSFKQVVMVQFPRPGVYSVGFITSEELEEIQARTEQDVVTVFVPTTPNPTTGFLIAFPRAEVVRLDMSVDEAFRMLLTLGVVVPKWRNRPHEHDLAPQQPPP